MRVGYLFFFFCLLHSVLLAEKITVGPQARITSIGKAIQIARDGDTLIVQPGIYTEGEITISKALVLMGEGWPVIDGQHKYQNFTITSNHVSLAGFRIINTGTSSMNDLAGVGAEDVSHLTILNCRFENTYFGVHLSNSKFVTVQGNEMTGQFKADHQTGNGIHLWKCSNAIIRNNRVLHHRDGIYFEFVTHSLIERNHCEQNLRYGLHFMFSHHDTYTKNRFKANGAGVAVMYTHHVEMYDNYFENNWGDAAYGILLKDISNCYIERNFFLKNTVGILMEGTNRGNFDKNTFSANGWAIKLQANCEGNSFTRNNFLGNSFDVVTNGTLVLNAFQHNYWDKYQGYDLHRDGTGDVPFRPVSMYAIIIDRVPEAVMLWRSFLVFLLDKTERVVPAIIPENLKDDYPKMKAYDFNSQSQ